MRLSWSSSSFRANMLRGATRKILPGLLCLFTMFGCYYTNTSPAHAQAVGSGQLQGTVVDPTGSAVAGATIEAVQQESGLHRTVVSDPDGGYNLPNLPVGPYELTVTQAGFDAYHQTGIVIQVGNNIRLNVTLQVGGITQTIQVNAGAAMVQTDDQSVSQVIDQQRVVDIPLNGRQPTQLILLTGAATTAPNGDLVGTKNYPSSVSLSIAGSQGTSTNYLMDGADNNDAFSNVNLPFPFPDAMQEFSVQTSGLSAQYGLHPGADVNIVTKSGTNAFHGTLFNFFRNGDLNAINYLSNKQDSLKRNQFGGVIGGPIVKQKLFFFGGYQGTRTRQQTNNITSYVPTAAMLSGDFTAYESAACQSSGKDATLGAPFSGNKIDPSQLNQQALNFAKYLPNTTNPCGAITYGVPQPQNEDQFISRVDWNKSDKQTLFGRYFLTHFTQPGFFGGNILMAANPRLDDQAQSLVIGHTYSISSSLVNSARLNGTRNFVSRGGASDIPNPQSLGINVASPVPNYIYINVTGKFSGACGTCEEFDITTNAINAVDDLFLTKGKHHFAFGANVIHNHLNIQGTNNENGQFTFSGSYTGDALADFMLGNVQTVYQGNATASTYRQNTFGLYAQDTYQVTSKLTLNAGVRWESDLPEVETAGRGVSFSAAAFAAGTVSSVYKTAPPGLLFIGDKGIPNGYIQNHWSHFQPRIGFAWDPRGKGQESIRGSYTLGFQTPLLYLEGRFENDAPFGDAVTLTQPTGGLSNPFAGFPGGNPFPQPFPPSKTSAYFPSLGTYFVFPTNLKPGYTQTWNLSLEKQFGKDWELTAAYLGNHVLHIWAGNELDPAVYIPGNWTGPGTCGALTVSPGMNQPCSSTGNTNNRRTLILQDYASGSYYSQVSQEYDGATASYNGALFTLQHRFANHFTLLSNYTFSHCMSSASDYGDLSGNTYQNPADPNADRGNCAVDLRHNFVTSLVAKSSMKGSGLKHAFLDGWQVAPIIDITSGTPFTVLTGTDKSLTGVFNSSGSSLDRPNLLKNPYVHNQGRKVWLDYTAFQANTPGIYGTTRPNQFYGPSYADLDTAVTRFVPVTETMQLEVRAECFNCLNHPNLPAPNNTSLSSSGNFGKITANTYTPRINQISLKFDF